MAGQGPPPKQNRQRRNPPARGEWIDLPALDGPVLPELPRGDWHPRTVQAWNGWRRDPATTQFGPADLEAALVLLHLYDELARKPSASLAGEVRQWLDRLGLNPKGKRDLRWRVKPPAEVVEHPTAKSRKLRAV